MKSNSAVSSMCRACAQRSRPVSQSNTLLGRSPAKQSSQPSTLLTLRQSTRSLSSTTSPHQLASNETSTAAVDLSQPQPPRLTPAQLLSRAPSSSLPKPFLTATVTRLHASTAHATRTIPLPSKHLRKSFLTQTHDLVHDPYNVLRVGDVIRYSAFTAPEHAAREAVKTQLETQKAKRMQEAKGKMRLMGRSRPQDGKQSKRVRVRFVLRQVVSPFGEGVEERLAKMPLGVQAAEGGKGSKGKGKGMKGNSIVANLQVVEGTLDEVVLGAEVQK